MHYHPFYQWLSFVFAKKMFGPDQYTYRYRTRSNIVRNNSSYLNQVKMLSVYKSIIVNTFTANGKINLYYVTKFSLNLSLTVHYFYKKICSFTLVLCIRIVLDCL